MKNSQLFNYLLCKIEINLKKNSNKKNTFLRNSRRKSGVSKMNGTAITNRLQNSFKIKDNNLYGSSYYRYFVYFPFDA